jgi:O-acetyl-ADP-ribose deacetylase (regulator of RNase III)
MGGGVAAALRSRGGIEVHQEAIRHAPARIGSVVRTGAGRLAARYVYHAVVIDYDDARRHLRFDSELTRISSLLE